MPAVGQVIDVRQAAISIEVLGGPDITTPVSRAPPSFWAFRVPGILMISKKQSVSLNVYCLPSKLLP